MAARTIELSGYGGTIKCVFGAADAPAATDDETKGFSAGSFWKVTDGALYICDSAAEGAADWDNVTTP
jgi:hypothetical protein